MKPILFCDFDGTLCHDLYWRSLSPTYHEALQELLFRNDTTMVNDWMSGKYTAEEVNEYVAEKIGIPYEELWKIFVDDCKSMRCTPGALEKLSLLRTNYIVILMTVNMDSFTRFTSPSLQLEKYCDCISNSFHEGRMKTDKNGSLFVDYAKKYEVALDTCVLIDDHKGVCKTFEALGGTAKLITKDKDIMHHLSTLHS